MKHMPVRILVCLCLAAAVVVSIRAQVNRKQPQQAPQDEHPIKLDTVLVTIPLMASDRDGRYIPNLTKRDFHIFEDDVEQEIDYFDSVEAPFNVVLLLDTSSSTRFKLDDIQRAATAFVEELRPQDRVMAVSFDTQIYVDSEFTGDRARLRRAISQTRTGSGTRLYDAVDLVLTERLNKVQGRKAIVLFSDGIDTASRLATALSSMELVEESGALIYSLQYDTSSDVLAMTNNRPNIKVPPHILDAYRSSLSYMRELGERTGGRYYKAEAISNVKQAFSLIAEELRHQYSLGYYPKNTARDGSYRRIRVRVDQPDVVIRARAGYRAAEDSPASKEPPQSLPDRPELKRSKP